MRATLILVSAAALAAMLAPIGVLAAPDVPCTCRFKGQDMQIGQTVCAQLPNGDVMLVCDRVLNNTAWKTVQQGCAVSQTTPLMTPTNG